MEKKSVAKNYRFLAILIGCMIALRRRQTYP